MGAELEQAVAGVGFVVVVDDLVEVGVGVVDSDAVVGTAGVGVDVGGDFDGAAEVVDFVGLKPSWKRPGRVEEPCLHVLQPVRIQHIP